MEIKSRRVKKLKPVPKGIDFTSLKTVSEYAEKINLSPQRIYQMIDEGTIKAYRKGKTILLQT